MFVNRTPLPLNRPSYTIFGIVRYFFTNLSEIFSTQIAVIVDKLFYHITFRCSEVVVAHV